MERRKILLIFLLFLSFTAFAQDPAVVCKNAVNSTVTILTDSVCGSGFFVDDSIIVTNYHVIKNAKKLYYCLNNSAVKYGIEGYVSVDKTFDLILLKVSGPIEPAIPIATAPVDTGQKIYDIAGSTGLPSSISGGNLIKKMGLNDDTLFLISAKIPDKGSGGPVLNSNGELIGVSLIHHVNGQNLTIAMPVKYIGNLLKSKSSSSASLAELDVPANTPTLASKAYFREGLQKYLYEDYKGSLRDFSNALNLNPKDTNIYQFLGITKLLMNDYVGAITAYKYYLQLNPNSFDAYYHRGVARRKIEDYKEALQDFDSAIKFDPYYAQAYLNRGVVLIKIGNYDEAEDDLTQAIDLDPNYSNGYISNALIQEKAQHYRAAIQALTICLGLNPNEFIALLLRGYAYLKLENLNGFGSGASLNDYRTGLLYFNTKDINPDFYCGLAKYKLGDYKIAVQYFNKAIGGEPRYTEAYYYRGLSNICLLNYQDAIKDFNTAITLNPQNGAYFYYRAVAKLHSGDKDGACADLKTAIKLGYMDAAQLSKPSCQ